MDSRQQLPWPARPATGSARETCCASGRAIGCGPAAIARRHSATSQRLSAFSRTEVVRALLPLGAEAVRRGREVLGRVDLLRINDRILNAAGLLAPPELRSLDAIHLASAEQLGGDLRGFVTYDERLAAAAAGRGFRVIRPA